MKIAKKIFFILMMAHLGVSSVQAGTEIFLKENGSSLPEEEISLNFKRVTLNYGSRQNRDGSIKPGFDFNWHSGKTGNKP